MKLTSEWKVPKHRITYVYFVTKYPTDLTFGVTKCPHFAIAAAAVGCLIESAHSEALYNPPLNCGYGYLGNQGTKD